MKIKNYIQALDFSLLKVKLMFDKQWSDEKVNVIEKKYKNFLYLHWKYRTHHLIVPTDDIDQFWHEHILDTRSYREHTHHIFGNYLDHDPYAALNAESINSLAEALNRTASLYFYEFNENY
jgi:hypothetical protein